MNLLAKIPVFRARPGGLFSGVAKAIRDTGIAMDKLGASWQGSYQFTEELCRHKRVMSIGEFKPVISQGAWIAPSAAVIGRVNLGEKTLVWYGAVIRGDIAEIKVGNSTVIGDRVIIHVSSKPPQDTKFPTVIGDKCIIEPGALLHACTLEDGSKIESGAMVLDGAVVRKGAIVTSGSLVVPGKEVPAGEVWSGTPAKFVRKVTDEERESHETQLKQYYEIATKHDQFHSKTEAEKEKEFNPRFNVHESRSL